MSGRGLKAVVDVQHVYRTGLLASDRGARFTLQDGRHLYESDASLVYASAIAGWLRAQGATVWTNDPARGLLVGPYHARQRSAVTLGANLYLACHLNAGHGEYAMVEYSSGNQGAIAARMVADELGGLPEVSNGKVEILTQGDRGLTCVREFTGGPGLLLEPLFGDSPKHQPLLTDTGLMVVGETIARALLTWWSTQPLPITGVPA